MSSEQRSECMESTEFVVLSSESSSSKSNVVSVEKDDKETQLKANTSV